jgi:hypothetical protein
MGILKQGSKNLLELVTEAEAEVVTGVAAKANHTPLFRARDTY